MHATSHATASRLMGALLLVALSMTLVPIRANAAVSSWQKGVSLYPSSQTDYASDGFKQVVAHVKTLGVNYITLIIPYYQSNVNSTDIQRGWNTPTDASLISGIQYIHSEGMHVMLKPQLDPYDGQWRANINPSDRSTWYRNYTAMILSYATLAEQQGVEELCVGAELIDMAAATQNSDNTAEWQNIISQVRGAYSGLLTYSANWGGSDFADEADHIQFWNSLNSVGISAYYNLNTDGSVSSLEGAWNQWNTSTIKPLSQRWGKPVLFTEIGYKSVSGAHYAPWNSSLGGSYDATEQSNDYQALFDYWNNQPFMEGVQLWYEAPNPTAGGSGNIDYTPQNKPAEGVMAQWFTAGSTGGSGQASVTMSGSANPTSVPSGQPVSLTAAVNNNGGALSGANVDLEVYSGGTQVFQKIFSNQNFSSGQTLSFTANWTPPSSGTYTFKVGVFSSDWSHLYAWNNSAAQISATSAGAGGASGTGSGTIDIWWPTNGAAVSGTQPFKALLENMPLSQYQMYWQVDGGALVLMYDSSAGYPHKEAQVDLSGWHWRGNGPYTITFVAKDGGGNTVAQSSVQISVY